jgi:hypothetical protein
VLTLFLIILVNTHLCSSITEKGPPLSASISYSVINTIVKKRWLGLGASVLNRDPVISSVIPGLEVKYILVPVVGFKGVKSIKSPLAYSS